MATATDEKATAPGKEATATDAADRPAPDDRGRKAITVSVRRSTVLIALALALLLAGTLTFGCLYWSARSTLDHRDAVAADNRHAENIASNYALGASTIDFHDVKGWLTRLKAGTSPQLSAKFDATAPQLEQILLPLQWTSKATPQSATVTSESGGIYKVDAYLTVNSTSVQTPDGAQTTVTYSITIDRNTNWTITDVGGLHNALPAK
ncbi:hypothetical protein [Nocardia sp. BMG51109]|uniref:hypothetical protein n=1 Tax=Nocardia sp. BMG51109 TaxID=1056816 RepID=UPI0004635A38|nr:hypothetical protein [Nocardia sp. BMG51109]